MSAAPPAQVHIGPFRYRIVVDRAAMDRAGQEERQVLCGHTDPNTQTCTVAPDMPRDREADTVLHELMHAALHHAGLDAVLAESDLEERVVNGLSPWLLGILRDNPDLVAYLTRLW